MGYAWHEVCYQDAAAALEAFARSVPAVDAVGINSFTAAPTINGTGLVSWSILNQPLTGASGTTQSGTTQLLGCSNPDFAQWDVQSLLFYCALFFAAFLGFRTGYRP